MDELCFVCQQPLLIYVGLFPSLSHYGYYCYKRLCTYFGVGMFSVLLHTYIGVELLGHLVSLFNLLRSCPAVLHSGYTIYIVVSTV
jgi:hypothetical protein